MTVSEISTGANAPWGISPGHTGTIKDYEELWQSEEYPPFQRYVPEKPVTLTAVQVTVHNLEAVGYFILCHGKGGVIFPADRQSFVWNGTRFDVGSWVVLEWIDEGGIRWALIRHVTEEETQVYALA